MDEMVLTVQKWVNSTYGGKNGFSKAPETGVTGWSTVYSLTRALQLELNIAVPSDNFGDGTSAAYKKWGEMELNKVPTSQQGVNIVKILQGSMYCKGYNPGGFNGTFGEGTKSAVIRLQTDAGLPIRDGKVYDYIFKAFLTMDAFVLTLGGDEKTRQIQQDLNNKYYKTSGVQPCDGHYQRGTNKALVYGLQTEMKIPASEQTGSVGPATREGLPTLKEGSSGRFVTLFQYALYFNGYDSSPFSGSFNSLVKSKVIEFQKFTLLGSDGIAGKQTWLSALVSTGDPNRKGKACDCITEITPDRALALKNAGYETVGRYLTNAQSGTLNKMIQPGELQTIFNSGLTVFPIYQTNGGESSYFNSSQGRKDAQAAYVAAQKHGFNSGTTIYFAVDYDAYGEDITNNILPHFKAIHDLFDFYGKKYNVGIYGARNVCIQVSEKGYASNSFVSGMSTGFSGNLGYPLPKNWAFDQISTVSVGSGNGYIVIDNNIKSGKDPGVKSVTPSSDVLDVPLDNKYKDIVQNQVADYINSVMSQGQKTKSIRIPHKAIEIVLENDEFITELSQKYKMRKALIQTAMGWEASLEGVDDVAQDSIVAATHNYFNQLEAWEKLSPAEKAVTPAPIPPALMAEDCSTGYCQIFSWVAIDANNWAIDKGLITGKIYDKKNRKDIWEVWQKLHNDVEYNIATCALVLLWGVQDILLHENYLNYTPTEIKKVLARYNGTDNAAKEYGERNYGIYEIFEHYNELSRNS